MVESPTEYLESVSRCLYHVLYMINQHPTVTRCPTTEKITTKKFEELWDFVRTVTTQRVPETALQHWMHQDHKAAEIVRLFPDVPGALQHMDESMSINKRKSQDQAY